MEVGLRAYYELEKKCAVRARMTKPSMMGILRNVRLRYACLNMHQLSSPAC